MDVQSKLHDISANAPQPREDELTKTIERYTGAIPSSAFLTVAVAAMAVSLAAQMAGGGKWGNFIAQWAPTWLMIGLYNKMVKLEGHDRSDRADTGRRGSAISPVS
jgi:hypothetical protein